jgi:hypothetical protein
LLLISLAHTTTTIAISLLLTVLVVLRLLLFEAVGEEEEGLIEGDREVKVEG